MKLNNIPYWMEEFLPILSEGNYKTSAELIAEVSIEKNGMEAVLQHGVIEYWNNTIELLELLHKSNKLVLAPAKPKSSRVDWEAVSGLLKDGVNESSSRWNEVLQTNVCISWYKHMIS